MKTSLIKRTITSIIFVVVLIGSLILGPITFIILFATIIILGLWEYYKIVRLKGYKPQRLIGIVFGLLVLTINFMIASGRGSPPLFVIYMVPVVTLAILELYKTTENPFINISHTLFGVFYVAAPLSMINYLIFSRLHNGEYNPDILIAVLIFIWINDSGAYIVGSLIGKHKLFPRISPNKTWEGSIGGGILAICMSLVIAQYISAISLIHWIVIAIITVVFGTFGDLTESMLKRTAKIKDSGNILPGHGGILDRFDSLLMAAPMVLLYITLVNYIL